MKSPRSAAMLPCFRPTFRRWTRSGSCFAEVRERFGLLDCLVNNAARFTRFDPLDITEADWDFIHSVNLKGTFFCCQEGARMMNERGAGRIVNISSLGGIRPWAEHVHYCASKAGVIMMTKALAKALAPRITVNSVAPGVIAFNDVDCDASENDRCHAHAARRHGGELPKPFTISLPLPISLPDR